MLRRKISQSHRGIPNFIIIIFVIVAISMISIATLLELQSASTKHTTSYPSNFVFGVAGLSGSDYPASFISQVTSKYGITAFRMDNTVFAGPYGDQIPKYASNGAKFIYANFGANQSENPQSYASNIVSVVEANPQISMVGLMNEPNCQCGGNGGYWNPQIYATFLNDTYYAMKQAGLKQPLCAFETSGDVSSQAQSWIKQVINDGGAGHYDAVCVHSYPLQNYFSFSQAVSAISSNLDSLHSLVGTNVPIYITETNVGGGNGNYVYGNVAGDTKTLISMYLTKPYIKGVFYYSLSGSEGLGLFTANRQPTILATTYSGFFVSCGNLCATATSSTVT